MLVDSWGYLTADFTDLDDYADLERMDLDCLTQEVIACAMKVHRLLGCGFLEIVYDRAMAFELERKNIVFQRQAVLPVRYGDQPIGTFIADYLVEKQIILELKAS